MSYNENCSWIYVSAVYKYADFSEYSISLKYCAFILVSIQNIQGGVRMTLTSTPRLEPAKVWTGCIYQADGGGQCTAIKKDTEQCSGDPRQTPAGEGTWNTAPAAKDLPSFTVEVPGVDKGAPYKTVKYLSVGTYQHQCPAGHCSTAGVCTAVSDRAGRVQGVSDPLGGLAGPPWESLYKGIVYKLSVGNCCNIRRIIVYSMWSCGPPSHSDAAERRLASAPRTGSAAQGSAEKGIQGLYFNAPEHLLTAVPPSIRVLWSQSIRRSPTVFAICRCGPFDPFTLRTPDAAPTRTVSAPRGATLPTASAWTGATSPGR
jgi:hypothetical protein